MSRTLDPILGPNLKLLLIGQNPAPKSCKNGTYFTSNTAFWKLLCESKMTSEILVGKNWKPGDDKKLKEVYEIGITDLFHTPDKFSRGLFTKDERSRLEREIQESNPTVLGFIGKEAYKTFMGIRGGLCYGPQKQYASRHVFVLPFPVYPPSHNHKTVMYNDLAWIVNDIELYRIPGRQLLINGGCESSICAKCLGGNCTDVRCTIHTLDKKYEFRLRSGTIRPCRD